MVAPPALTPYRRGIVGVVVLLGTGLSLLIWRLAERQDAERIRSGFRNSAQTQATVATQRLHDYQEMVYSLRDTFLGQSSVTREEFTQVARSLLQRHHAVQALEWVRIVPRQERAGFEKQMSAELGRPVVIRRRQPDGTIQPAAEADEYFVITYVEPLAGNEAVLGYDVSSAPSAPLLAASRTDGTLKISQPFRLMQSRGPDDDPGVTFILPFARAEEPENQTEGFVQSVFYVRAMLAQANQLDTNQALDAYYLDVERGQGAPALLYASIAGSELVPTAGVSVPLPALDDPADFHARVPMGNRQWLLIMRQNAAWTQRVLSPQPRLILAASLTITALLALFINQLLQRTSRIEQVVAERTRELRASEARLQAILDHSPAIIFLKDPEGRYLLCNQAFADLCQRPRRDILGRTDHELFPAATAEYYRGNDARALAAGHPLTFEETVPAVAHGSTNLVLKFPLLDEQGRTYALCGISTDITERKRAEVELQESRRQLSNLISQLPGTAFRCLFDEHLTSLFASEGMFAITGYPAEDFTGGRMHIAELTKREDREHVRGEAAAAIAARRAFEIEYRITHRDGREKWILVRGRPVYDEVGALRFLEGLAIDITDLKQAGAEKLAFERNLLETQKLESLGVLAGGIAHDFNNLLTAVLGNASLARHSLPETGPVLPHLEQIEKAARRAAELCQQMLAYAGKGRLTAGPINLTSLVQDTTSLLEVSIRKNCMLCLQLAADLPVVTGDASQLRQIVMNLVINGSDAVGERTGGRISVTTFACDADAALFQTALHQPKLPAGRYVGLEVRDNGCGMPAETLARIFEPFFTTKFSGRGLGLSAVLGIVQSHQGALFAESHPGLGSTFRLLLPAATHIPEAKRRDPPAAPPQTLHGTVLVVDDEEAVRLVAGTVLRRHGATVLSAADGSAALELWRRQPDTISVILLDLTMPGLSGEDVLRALKQSGARSRVVVMSGYSEEETMQRCTALGAAGFLRKPFELQTLMVEIQKHLG